MPESRLLMHGLCGSRFATACFGGSAGRKGVEKLEVEVGGLEATVSIGNPGQPREMGDARYTTRCATIGVDRTVRWGGVV